MAIQDDRLGLVGVIVVCRRKIPHLRDAAALGRVIDHDHHPSLRRQHLDPMNLSPFKAQALDIQHLTAGGALDPANGRRHAFTARLGIYLHGLNLHRHDPLLQLTPTLLRLHQPGWQQDRKRNEEDEDAHDASTILIADQYQFPALNLTLIHSG